MKNTNINYGLHLGFLSLIAFFFIIKEGSDLIIPFIIALLFSFAILGLSDFYKKFKFPGFFSMLASISTYILLLWLFAKVINSNIQDVIELFPSYQEKLKNISFTIMDYLNIDNFDTKKKLDNFIENIDLFKVFTLIMGGITSVFSQIGIIFFYMLFILLEVRYFSRKLELMFPDESQRKKTIDTIKHIKSDIKYYFIIKTFISFCTAFLSYLVLLIFGLDFPVFWALLIFLLNFIPNVGSIIAVAFPIALSLINYDSIYPFIGISISLIGVQVLMGNFIEPKFMGNKLNLSPLVIILSLGFWGYLWGIIGMLLSVPIMVVINIILSKFDTTKPISILLSEKGDIRLGDEEVIKKRKVVIDKIKDKFRSKKLKI